MKEEKFLISDLGNKVKECHFFIPLKTGKEQMEEVDQSTVLFGHLKFKDVHRDIQAEMSSRGLNKITDRE